MTLRNTVNEIFFQAQKRAGEYEREQRWANFINKFKKERKVKIKVLQSAAGSYQGQSFTLYQGDSLEVPHGMYLELAPQQDMTKIDQAKKQIAKLEEQIAADEERLEDTAGMRITHASDESKIEHFTLERAKAPAIQARIRASRKEVSRLEKIPGVLQSVKPIVELIR